jgi:hypothetical protein
MNAAAPKMPPMIIQASSPLFFGPSTLRLAISSAYQRSLLRPGCHNPRRTVWSFA